MPLLSQHTPLYISLKEINFCKCVFYFFIEYFYLRSDLDLTFQETLWAGGRVQGGKAASSTRKGF